MVRRFSPLRNTMLLGLLSSVSLGAASAAGQPVSDERVRELVQTAMAQATAPPSDESASQGVPGAPRTYPLLFHLYMLLWWSSHHAIDFATCKILRRVRTRRPPTDHWPSPRISCEAPEGPPRRRLPSGLTFLTELPGRDDRQVHIRSGSLCQREPFTRRASRLTPPAIRTTRNLGAR